MAPTVRSRSAAPKLRAAATATAAVVCLLSLSPAAPAAFAPDHQTDIRTASAADVRRALVPLVNAERAKAGAPPLAPSAVLDRAAQSHAEELAAAGSLDSEHRSEKAMESRLAAAGYEAEEWGEGLESGPPTPADLVAAWKRNGGAMLHRLLDPAFTEIGVGTADLHGAPLYTVLFAEPRAVGFARETAPLRDLARVRGELLAEINAERRRARRRPLVENSALEEAAQFHAQDMLARSFFAHADPDGRTVRERAFAAGYAWRTIGENLAEGQPSVQAAVTAWMNSPDHRANILNQDFEETGIGLAVGRDAQVARYRIIWVQTFGLGR